jgi:hypothetical protein
MNSQNAEQLLFNEHLAWLRSIDVYKNALKNLQSSLETIAPNFSNKRTSGRVEQFQNRFIRQGEVIDILRHNIKSHENDLERLDLPSNRLFVDHVNLREEYYRFCDLFIEMEQEFYEFVS